MKISNRFVFVSLFLVSVASGRLMGGDSIDVDLSDNVILEHCEGHKMNDINYIIAPESSCVSSGGLMGVWGCRQEPQEHSICLPSINGSVVGLEGDQCGCCQGICPSLCKCRCAGGVYVREPFWLGLKRTRCVEEGLLSRSYRFGRGWC